MLDFPGAAAAVLLDKLPQRKQPIAGFQPKVPVKRLDWQMPFPAQWRVDYVLEEDHPNGWLRNREMLIPSPYPVQDGKCRGFHFAKPTFEWDYGGHADRQERGGTPERYPCWVDFEGRGHVQPGGGSYAVLVYPFDRGRGTPLEALTLTDLLRQTLGVGPCRYILDADRRSTQTPGIFTCGGTTVLARLEEGGKKITEHRQEAEKLIGDMLVFVKAYRRRIQQYMAFKQDVFRYLDDQQRQHPEQREFTGRMRGLLEQIPDALVEDAPAVVERLNAEYRSTLDSDAPAAGKLRDELHKRYRDAGGVQDHVLGHCNFSVKLLRYRAGMTVYCWYPQSDNYNYRKNKTMDYYSMDAAPQVETRLAAVCDDLKLPYAVAGLSAAWRLAPHVRYQRAMAYMPEGIDEVVQRLALKPVASGPNVTLLVPYDDGVLAGSQVIGGIRATAPIQTYLDLRGFRGRGEEAAWDICMAHYPGGLEALADTFRPHLTNGLVKEGLNKIKEKFASPDHVGPTWVADFEEIDDAEARAYCIMSSSPGHTGIPEHSNQ